MPSLGATGGDGPHWRRRRPSPMCYTAGVGITDFELDLFGRVRSLSQAALQQYFAQEEARRSAQLALIAEVANAYLALAADQEQLRVVQLTLTTREEFHALTQKRYEFGAVSALDVSQSRTQVEAARADVARFSGQAAQTANALQLLVGAPVGADLLPQSFGESVTGLAARCRPDCHPKCCCAARRAGSAEHVLRADNANIGAARAAFFPSIKLTGSVGSASDELSGLFDAGTGVWVFAPKVNLPIFEGGRLRANLDVARADRDIALAQYEQAIQAGFREVADALALTAPSPSSARRGRRWSMRQREGDRLAGARYKAGPRQLPGIARIAARSLPGAADTDRHAPGRADESRDAVQGARRRLAGARAMNAQVARAGRTRHAPRRSASASSARRRSASSSTAFTRPAWPTSRKQRR